MKVDIDKVILVVALAWFLIGSLIVVNNYRDVDESTHSFVALFFTDLIKDWLRNPTLSFDKIYNYAYTYLVFYPKLSLHYPPLSQMLFSIGYLLYKPSIIIGRIVIVALASALILLVYEFSKFIFRDKKAALIASLLTITSPIIFLSSFQAMQEIPFVFFFTLTMFILYKIITDKHNDKNYIILAVLMALTMITKFQAVVILPVVVITTFVSNKKHLVHVLISIVISLLLLTPYYYTLWKTNLILIPISSNLVGDPQDPTFLQLEGWTYYIYNFLFKQVSIAVGIFLLISLIIFLGNKFPGWKFFLTWIVVVYVVMTIVHNKDPRYTINYIPAFTMPAAYIFSKFISKSNFAIITLILVIVLQVISSMPSIKVGFLDVADISKYLVENASGNILINSELDITSPFIFEIARIDKFKHVLYRPCLINDFNESSSRLIKNFDIEYVLVYKNKSKFTENQIIFDTFIKDASQEFTKVKDFSEYIIYKKTQFELSAKKEKCNYVCATRKFVCTKFNNPLDSLK